MSSAFDKLIERSTWIAIGLMSLMATVARVEPLNDEDTWWHLQVGREVLASKSWHLTEVASFLKHGEVWVDTEWLYDVVLHVFEAAFGVPGVILFSAGLAGVAVVLLGKLTLTIADQRPTLAIAVTALVSATLLPQFTPRPHALGIVLLLSALLWLEREPEELTGSKARVWWIGLACLQLFWSHAHDSHILLGLLLWIRAGSALLESHLERARRRALTAAGISIMALALGPLSVGIVPRLLRHVGTFATSQIWEWEPTTFESIFPRVPDHVFWYLALLIIAGAMLLLRRRARLSDLGTALLGLILLMVATRFRGTSAVLLVPLICRRSSRQISRENPGVEAALAALLALTTIPTTWMALSPPWPRPALGVWSMRFPVHATQVLDAHDAQGRLLNVYNDGGYLIDHRPDGLQITIDGRTPAFYDDFDYGEYWQAIGSLGGFSRFVARYHVDHVLLPRHAPLCPVARRHPDFRTAFVDEHYVLLTRRNGALLQGVDLRGPACEGETAILRRACPSDPHAVETLLSEMQVLERLAPESAWPWIVRLSVASFCKERGLDGADIARKVLDRGAESPPIMNLVAKHMIAAGRLDEAVKACDLGLKYPNSERLWALKGAALAARGDLLGALAAFQKGEKASGGKLAGAEHMRYAETLKRLSRFDEAAWQALLAAWSADRGAFVFLRGLRPSVSETYRAHIDALFEPTDPRTRDGDAE